MLGDQEIAMSAHSLMSELAARRFLAVLHFNESVYLNATTVVDPEVQAP